MKVDIYDTNKKYDIIYADPPWRYADSTPPKGAVKYPTMTLSQIKDMPIGNIANKDCALFLWVTMPMLAEGLEVIKAWGFDYRTCAFVWVKQNAKSENLFCGLGRWTRGNAEICLFAKRGKPQRVSRSVRQIVLSPREEHSKKPDEVRDRIIELLGDLPRIELFARQHADGWDCWGNEV